MKVQSSGLIIGISIGVVIGVILAIFALFCFRYHRRRSQIGISASRTVGTISLHSKGGDPCTELSDSSVGTESCKTSKQNGMPLWLGFGGPRKSNVVSASGILEYSYRYLSPFNKLPHSFNLITAVRFNFLQTCKELSVYWNYVSLVIRSLAVKERAVDYIVFMWTSGSLSLFSQQPWRC